MKFLSLLLILIIVVVIIYGVGKVVWSATRGGQVERLARLSDKQLRRADRAYKMGRPGLAEKYLDLHERMLNEIDERNEKPF